MAEVRPGASYVRMIPWVNNRTIAAARAAAAG
jgi:hypothetical protein